MRPRSRNQGASHGPACGRQRAPEHCGVFLSGKQPRPHGDCRHGRAFTHISMATARSLQKAAPPGGTRALSPLPGVYENGDREKDRVTSPALHIAPPSSRPSFPPSTLDRKTNRRTHLSTAHVSLTARAGFPWSMGFLKSVRSSSKAIIWGWGHVPVRVGAGLPPSRTSQAPDGSEEKNMGFLEGAGWQHPPPKHTHTHTRMPVLPWDRDLYLGTLPYGV